MNIGIITLFDNGNYGSELQSLAMNDYLASKGHNAVFIKVKAKNKFLRALELLVDRIRKTFILRKDSELFLYNKDRESNQAKQRNISPDLRKKIHEFMAGRVTMERVPRYAFPPKCGIDAFICGSDQVWSALRIPLAPEFFLSSVPKSRKIAYAPSIGIDNIPTYYQNKAGKYIKEFKFLSVREDAAKEALKEKFGQNAVQVLDPTMLVGKEFWDSLLEKECKKEPPFDYIFCYFLGEVQDAVLSVIERLSEGKKVIMLPYEEDSKRVSNGQYKEADPLEFVNLIKYADCVLTDSFHGSVFSVLYGKRFVVTKRTHVGRVSQTSRIKSLLRMVHQEERYCSEKEDIERLLTQDIDSQTVENEICKMQTVSRDFLDNALKEVASSIER